MPLLPLFEGEFDAMSQKKSGPAIPLENMRIKLLSDPDTRRIARDVGMKLEEYVELVLQYLAEPNKEPQLYVASDEDLRAAGYEPPSPQAVGEFLIAGARGDLGLGEAPAYKTGFDAAPDTQGKPSLGAEDGREQLPVDDETSQELRKQLPKRGPPRP